MLDVVTSDGPDPEVDGLAPSRRYSPSLQGCRHFFFGRRYIVIWIVTSRFMLDIVGPGKGI